MEHALTEEGKDIYPPLDDPNESKLYRISKQLLQLVRIQNQRLASDNPNHITEEEQQRADEIERNLTEACALVQPGDVVSEQALFDLQPRNAAGKHSSILGNSLIVIKWALIIR